MKRQSIVVVAAMAIGLAFATATQASTIGWSAIGAGVSLPDGTTAVPYGDVVEMGYFTGLTDLAIAGDTTTAGTLVLQGAFTALASGNEGDGGDVGFGGNFGEATAINVLGAQSGAAGKAIYMVMFAGGTSFTTATGLAIEKDSAFPTSEGPPPPSVVIDVNDLGAAGTALDIGVNNLGESANATFGPDFLPEGYITMAAVNVPEPSSIVLVLLGLVGGIGLIRRRS